MDNSPFDEILLPRKVKWLLVLLGSLAFTTIGLLMLRDPEVTSERTWAYLCTAFFGLCALVSLLQFVPGSSFLRLTPEGFTIRTMWRTKGYRWTEVARFGVAEFSTHHGPFRQRHRLVGFDFVDSYPRGRARQALMDLNRNLSGYEGALPDNYGRPHAELAAYLDQLRSRFGTGRTTDPDA